MNIELFDKAVDFIASRTDEQLDLGDWQKSWTNRGTIAPSSEYVNCGTIACAGGWIALSPEFNELGVYPGIAGAPRFDGDAAYSAMAKLFDIPRHVAANLFYFRTTDDEVQFGEFANTMTDRQLWLSRARMVRANYLIKKSCKFRNKPVEVEAFTFDDVLTIGRENAKSVVNYVPWSFTFKGYQVTRQRDDGYLIQLEHGAHVLTKDRMLVIYSDGAYVISKAIFEATYERV